MAAITVSKKLVSEGSGELAILYRLHNVNSGDTFDVAADFVEVKKSHFIPSGDLATSADGSVAGTVITLTLATMAKDSVYLLVVGQAANA